MESVWDFMLVCFFLFVFSNCSLKDGVKHDGELIKSRESHVSNINSFIEKKSPKEINMEITFYYNPVVYTEFRTEELVRKGDCEIKKSFLYEDLAEVTCINDVFREKPIFMDDSEKEGFYKNLIECLCIIKQGNEEIVKFTFSENPNQLYSLCNGRLIKRNEIYDKFSNEIIELIKKSEDGIK